MSERTACASEYSSLSRLGRKAIVTSRPQPKPPRCAKWATPPLMPTPFHKKPYSKSSPTYSPITQRACHSTTPARKYIQKQHTVE
jgi:hypothetical protein